MARRELEKLFWRKRARGEQLTQRDAFDVLHHNKRRPVVLANFVDMDDVRVIQGEGRSRLLFKSTKTVGVGSHIRRQHFDGDVAPEPSIPRPKDLAHTPAPNLLDNLVVRERATDHDSKPNPECPSKNGEYN